ncbi:unnamed protein product [Rotaria sordida]|uniref:Calpain catalytic domain-containing protein n=1 Tax=Rotaria sordida TaxID=392033 RepID=A0A819PZL2_9BILA|nr:unnamed protein product [Rotaria sordida]
MATALLDTHANSSLLSIINQWWCPICPVQTEDVTLCEKCQQMFQLLVEALPDNDQSKSIISRYPYTQNDKPNNVQRKVCDPSNLISHDHQTPLINSDQQASETSMSLTVRDRQHKHESNAEIIFQNIIKYCRKNKIHFIDDQFLHSTQSIGSDSFTQVSKWLQISNVAPSSDNDHKLPWTIFSSPKPSDIQQGVLGNCWLIAALALISERSRLLEHILLTKTVNIEGVYLVRICHNGLWKTIIVDDFFPCTKYNHLVFAQGKRRQLYVPLIEKACAKLFGSYAALKSGNILEGLQLLTGAPCDYINLKPSNTTFDGDIVWAKLLSACESKLLIGTSSGDTGVSSEEYARVHIHNNHAFSVLTAHALGNESLRFVLVRDPHSYSNYREESITESIRKQLRLINPADHATGAFWISWPRFLHYFSSITISTYNSDYFDIREQSKFTRSSIQPIMTYHFHVPKTSLIHISLIHHRHDRITRSSLTQSFVLCDADELASTGIVGKRESILICERGGFIYWTGSLRAGYYVLIPFSTSFWQNHKENRDFTLVIHSNIQFDLVKKNKPATFLADCLISAIIKNSKKNQDKEAIFYTSSDKLGSRIFIVENMSIENFLSFDMNIQLAKNIHHSRFIDIPNKTHDCIPPRYRQVIFIGEWIEKHGESANLTYAYSYRHEKQATDPRPSINISQYDFHSPRAF